MNDDSRREQIARILKEIHSINAEAEIMFRLAVWLRRLMGR